MDASNSAVIDAVSSPKAVPATKRQYRSPELKRQIVEETLAPGASVARVARAHGVNANQGFAGRWYQRGLLKPGRCATPGLLAVRVSGAGAERKDAQRPRTLSGTIPVELPKGQLRLTGCVVSLTHAQLSMLLEGIDWRRPARSYAPQMAV
jgi:transposase